MSRRPSGRPGSSSGRGTGRPGTGRPGTGRIFDDEPPGNWLQAITVPGRLAILAAIGVGALAFALSFEWFGNNWPGSFPLLVAAVPGALGAAAAFGLARLALHLAGVAFYVQDQ